MWLEVSVREEKKRQKTNRKREGCGPVRGDRGPEKKKGRGTFLRSIHTIVFGLSKSSISAVFVRSIDC